ncbi:hypothetical protein JHK87_024923 [Glycine soja]|nr:hypothetical protein JHK87_024923 [Glycine soja]
MGQLTVHSWALNQKQLVSALQNLSEPQPHTPKSNGGVHNENPVVGLKKGAQLRDGETPNVVPSHANSVMARSPDKIKSIDGSKETLKTQCEDR